MALFDLNSWRTAHRESPPISDSRFAVLDVETTGLIAERTDRVAEVAIVHLNGALEVTDEWSSLVNPNRDLGPTHIHGITGAMAKDAPPFSEVADDIVHRLAGHVLVAHNASFDIRFLEAEFERLDLAVPPLATVDTYGLTGRSLADSCRAYGVAHINAHAALGDARATADLLRQLVRTKLRGARTLADLECDRAPAPLTDWPSLSYEPTEHRRGSSAPAPTEPTHQLILEVGAWVCFTGDTQLMFDGELITRGLATELATHAKLIVKSGVSKKLRVLVAADVDSLSGKAKKARGYEIPIVGHQQFWSAVGIETAPVPDDWGDRAPKAIFGPR